MEVDQSLDISQESLFDRVVLFLAAGMFTLMIVLATMQVLIRTLNLPITAQWTEPAARFTLIVATFFGAAVASRNREHIRMTFVLNKLEEKRPDVRQVFDLISSVVVVVFVVFALSGTVPAIVNNWNSNLGGVGFVTSGLLYLGISVGLACMLIYESQVLYNEHLQKRFTRSSEESE
ncbi:TRAP transporter small permease subunit [Natronolimnobius sp. AArcel1]|uniref:TRAP transporter small permease n=1 Tax=Natronolimnobius sp. AArcel1 TaxID=1679093 RepID=UPI0013E9AD88|nr:TRAP transporter small permease subunit [Natronolimnobius sp. AArcel1]NGM67960.1 TRAP transporter small permease subunit [Natronolimnobius sp. AArcel1]